MPRAGILRSPRELRLSIELPGGSRSFGGCAVRPRQAVWTGDVEASGRVGEGSGEGMVGSAVSCAAVVEGHGDREERVGCERDGSSVRSRDFRVGVAMFALSSAGGRRVLLTRGGDGGWSSIGGSRGAS